MVSSVSAIASSACETDMKGDEEEVACQSLRQSPLSEYKAFTKA